MTNKTATIDNTQDVIDSRDIIARVEELTQQLQDEHADTFDDDHDYDPDADKFTEWLEDQVGEHGNAEAQELITLNQLVEDASRADDWEYGATLIHENYFTEYTEELCKDIGDMPKELPWYIENHIDWDGVAQEIKADYFEVDFNGEKYWVR
jgi:hypothetical protein